MSKKVRREGLEFEGHVASYDPNQNEYLFEMKAKGINKLAVKVIVTYSTKNFEKYRLKII